MDSRARFDVILLEAASTSPSEKYQEPEHLHMQAAGEGGAALRLESSHQQQLYQQWGLY